MADATILYNGPLKDTGAWLAVLPSTVNISQSQFLITANGLGLIIVKQGV